jgi:hypothetical protein
MSKVSLIVSSDKEACSHKFRVLTAKITNVKTRKQDAELERFKNELIDKLKKQYTLDF